MLFGGGAEEIQAGVRCRKEVHPSAVEIKEDLGSPLAGWRSRRWGSPGAGEAQSAQKEYEIQKRAWDLGSEKNGISEVNLGSRRLPCSVRPWCPSCECLARKSVDQKSLRRHLASEFGKKILQSRFGF